MSVSDPSLDGAYPENLSRRDNGARSSTAGDFRCGEFLGSTAGVGDFDLRCGGGDDRLGRRISSSSLISPSSRIWMSLVILRALWEDFGEDLGGDGGCESTAIPSSWP